MVEVTEEPKMAVVLEGESVSVVAGGRSPGRPILSLPEPPTTQLPSKHWVPLAFPKFSLWCFIFTCTHLWFQGFLACT